MSTRVTYPWPRRTDFSSTRIALIPSSPGSGRSFSNTSLSKRQAVAAGTPQIPAIASIGTNRARVLTKRISLQVARRVGWTSEGRTIG